MQGDTAKTSVSTVEQCKGLLQIWINITHALVSTGYAADLFRALNIASSTNQVCDDQASTTNQQSIDRGNSCVDLGCTSDLSAGGHGSQTINDYPPSIKGDDKPLDMCDRSMSLDNNEGEGDTVMVSDPKESDDYDMDDFLDVPPDPTSDVDLSQYRSNSLLQKFKALAIEEPLPVSYISPTGDTSLDVGSEQQQSVKTRKGRKSMPVRTSIKRDLTPAEINSVARSLIRDDAITFFMDNCQSIYEGWMSLLDRTTSACNDSGANTSVVAAFDVLDSIITGREAPLPLRFAYVQLIWAIDALKEVAATDRLAGRVHRKVGYSDASVAIDVYLNAKRKTLDIRLRSRLSEHVRIGRRWSELAGPSPLLLSVYSGIAETIVKNTSIKLASLNALAAQVQQISPELVRISPRMEN